MILPLDTDLAEVIGINEALVAHIFESMLLNPKAKNIKYHNGRYWIYGGIGLVAKVFNLWNIKQVRRIVDSLVAQGILLKGQFSKKSGENALWLTFSDKYFQLKYKTQGGAQC